MSERSLFLAALDIDDPSEQSAYLDQACAGNPALRAQVELLLKAHQQSGAFMERPAAALEVTIDDPISERPGTVIGPYKLMEQVGEGSMGLVFVAEQQRPVRRKVALKVIKPGMDTRQMVARFEAERQALALMDHPNIAKVFDGGTTDSGRLYFVMELVKGIPITDYCDQNQVPIRQRLELFISVCQALQHAHQKGIIHRDLKPFNVLVMSHDGTPVVKVIDFGVAKAIGQQLTDKTIYTQFSQMVGTLLYMSPEQAGQSGLDVDTRSDIYSLGVLLYELQTGTTPFAKERLREIGYDEIRRILREEEPPKPSTRISTLGKAATTVSTQRQSEPKRLSRLIRGELDWIVMKALEKDRNRRYVTANALALDIQRYLNDEPVQACPPSAAYRLRKFARRKKLPLLIAGMVLLLIVLLGGGVGWTIRDREVRNRAIEGKIADILEKADEQHKQGKWQEALAAAEQAKAALTSGVGDELQARVDNLLKELYLLRQLSEIRTRLADAFDHQSVDRDYTRLFGEFGIDVDRLSPAELAARIGRYANSAVWLAAALDEWALVRRDYGLHRPQDAAVWQRLLEAARLVDPDLWRSRLRQLMGREDRDALRQLADSSDMAALPPQSLRLMGQALAFSTDQSSLIAWLRKAHRCYPGDALISFDLAFHLGNLPSPPWADALQYAEAALAARPDSAAMNNVVGSYLSKLGRREEALAAYTKAIELDPKKPDAWTNRGFVYNNLPIPQYEKAVADCSKAIELDPNFAACWIERSTAYHGLGQYDNALADSSKGIELTPNRAWAWASRARTYCSLHQYEKALVNANKAIDLDARFFGVG